MNKPIMRFRKQEWTGFVVIICLMLLMSGCWADPASQEFVKAATNVCTESNISGFLDGIFHGMFSFFVMIAKYLFGVDIGIYAECNTGGWYWFGFLIGAGGSAGGSSSAASASTSTTRRRKT